MSDFYNCGGLEQVRDVTAILAAVNKPAHFEHFTVSFGSDIYDDLHNPEEAIARILLEMACGDGLRYLESLWVEMVTFVDHEYVRTTLYPKTEEG